MTDSMAVPSSFDSTRYTGADPNDHHPNLVQAQAEAVTNLLLGRSLGLPNTYAFDSRTALSLTASILDTRAAALKKAASSAGRQRIKDADPLILRWYSAEPEANFFDCCADQLRRLEGQRRFILSFWKPIDRNDELRLELARALTGRTTFPAAIKEIDGPGPDGIGEMERAFMTLLQLEEYCAERPGRRGGKSPGAKTNLVDYVTAFEELGDKELETVMDGGIDIDTVMHLQESVHEQAREDKFNRGWAHHEVDRAGGEGNCQPFFLQQRQLIDTLYNKVLADSLGQNHTLLSSVPRSVGNEKLEQVNAFALDLIRYIQGRRPEEEAAATFSGTPDMSELFLRASSVPDLQPAPLAILLQAYWELIADDDRWPAWQESCDRLEKSLHLALDRKRTRGHPGAQLSEAWLAHLTLLEEKMQHITIRDGKLYTSVDQPGEDHCTMTGLDQFYADSLSAAEYVDHYLKRAIG